MEKTFVKVMTMISVVIVDLFAVPYLIGAPSTMFLIMGILLIMLSLYAEIKIVISFFKKEKK